MEKLRNWEQTDINITPDGMVITESGEPVFVKPRSIMIYTAEGMVIDVIEELNRNKEK